MTLYLREDLARLWQGRDPFEQAARQEGVVYRAREGRRTLQFQGEGRSYFLKYHAGVGWKEVLKNLLQGKMAVLGAMAEVRAIRAVTAAGISSMTIAGYGSRGSNPARIQSFLVTDDLAGTVSLEEVIDTWHLHAPSPRFKWEMIGRVAEIARRMHEAGVNHRDFYLGHFLMAADAVKQEDSTATIFLIDLHRSQIRPVVPRRWQIKDLGGLYFSTARGNLTRRDLLRFLRSYGNQPLKNYLRGNGSMLDRCRREGERIYRRYFEQEPSFPLKYCEHPGKDI